MQKTKQNVMNENEKDLQRIKELRLMDDDFFSEALDGKIMDIEIQRSDRGTGVKRARFHSSMLDTKMLKAKQKFKELHDSYVIFIT